MCISHALNIALTPLEVISADAKMATDCIRIEEIAQVSKFTY